MNEDEKRQRGIAAHRLGLLVTFFFTGPQWAKTRGDLRINDVIVGIQGEPSPPMTIRQFHSHFRLRFNVGEKAVLNILRGDQRMDIEVPCLDHPGEG